MLKLPRPIKFNAFVQPVKFPSNCGDNFEDSIDAVAIGNGETNTPSDYIGFFRDIKLRQVDIRVMSKKECDEIKPISVDGAIYCAQPQNGQSIYHGDSGKMESQRNLPIPIEIGENQLNLPIPIKIDESQLNLPRPTEIGENQLNIVFIFHHLGGPLLRKSDGAMIGISSAVMRYDVTVTGQYFTRVHRYFDWISEITGLEMPKCH